MSNSKISDERRVELLREIAAGNENLLEFIACEKDAKDFQEFLEFVHNVEVGSLEAARKIADKYQPIVVNLLVMPSADYQCPRQEYRQLNRFAVERAQIKVQEYLAARQIIAHIGMVGGEQ